MTEAMDSECIGEKIQRAVQRAESRKQRAESSERCPPGGEKTHLAGDGRALTCTWPSTIGTGTTTVKRGGPSSDRWRLAGDELLARGRDDK